MNPYLLLALVSQAVYACTSNVAMVGDRSNSADQAANDMRTGMWGIVDGVFPDTNSLVQSEFGFYSYANSASVGVDYGPHGDLQGIDAAIAGLVFEGGTNMHTGLQLVYNRLAANIASGVGNGIENGKKLVIPIISDFMVADPTETLALVQAIQNLVGKDNVVFMALVVTGQDGDNIPLARQIVGSDPARLFHFPNTGEFVDGVPGIVDGVCSFSPPAVVTKTPTSAPSTKAPVTFSSRPSAAPTQSPTTQKIPAAVLDCGPIGILCWWWAIPLPRKETKPKTREQLIEEILAKQANAVTAFSSNPLVNRIAAERATQHPEQSTYMINKGGVKKGTNKEELKAKYGIPLTSLGIQAFRLLGLASEPRPEESPATAFPPAPKDASVLKKMSHKDLQEMAKEHGIEPNETKWYLTEGAMDIVNILSRNVIGSNFRLPEINLTDRRIEWNLWPIKPSDTIVVEKTPNTSITSHAGEGEDEESAPAPSKKGGSKKTTRT